MFAAADLALVGGMVLPDCLLLPMRSLIFMLIYSRPLCVRSDGGPWFLHDILDGRRLAPARALREKHEETPEWTMISSVA